MTIAILTPRKGQPGYRLWIQKADDGPLDIKGFMAREEQLFNELVEATRQASAQLRTHLQEIAVRDDLVGLFGRSRAGREANGALRTFANDVLEQAPDIVARAQQRIGQESVDAWSWLPGKGQDQLEIDALRRSSAMMMGTYLKETLPAKAQYAITQAYLEGKGLSRDEKLAKVQAELQARFGSVADAPTNYWQTVAVNALNNARSYAQLQSFAGQNVVAYRIQVVQDSLTSNICQAMVGKIFPVEQALERYEQFFQATSLEEVSSIKPMVQGTSQAGFSINAGGKQVPLDVSTSDSLIKAGCSCPPFHHHCRSGIAPVFGSFDLEALQQDESVSAADKATIRQLADITDQAEYEKTLAKLEGVEVVGVFKNGAKIFEAYGKPDAVSFPPEVATAFKDADLVHNHPPEKQFQHRDRLSPSVADVSVGATLNARQVRVVVPFDGEGHRVYSVERDPRADRWHPSLKNMEDVKGDPAKLLDLLDKNAALLRDAYAPYQSDLGKLMNKWAEKGIIKGDAEMGRAGNSLINLAMAKEMKHNYGYTDFKD